MHRYVLWLAALLWVLAAPASAQPAGAPSDPDPQQEAEDAPPVAQALPGDVALNYAPTLRIEGSKAFTNQVERSLDALKKLPSGAALLAQLGQTGRQTVIRDLRRMPISPEEQQNAYVRSLHPGGEEAASLKPGTREPGPGADALVMWNPDFRPEGFPQPLIMGHELLHALHAHKGELDMQPKAEGRDAGIAQEELRTTGLPGFNDAPITENKLRAEWNKVHPGAGVPQRKGYRFLKESDEEAAILRREDEVGNLLEQNAEDEAYMKELAQEAADAMAKGKSKDDPEVKQKLEEAAEVQRDVKAAQERIAQLERELDELYAKQKPGQGPGSQQPSSGAPTKAPAKGLKQILEEATGKR